MRLSPLLLLCVAACVASGLAAAPAAAQRDACPASAGAACALWSFPAFLPEILAGSEDGAALLAGVRGLSRDAVPLVPLSADPADGPALGALSARLTAEQEALLGCGPYWGRVCEADGIDLLNADAGVLQQSWVGLDGRYTAFPVLVPGARSPFLADGVTPNPAYDPLVDGAVLVLPRPGSGWQFASEMAALSFNLQILLASFSARPGADPSAPDQFDPADPYARGKCSFVQPQYCSSVQSFFDLTRPPTDRRAGGNGLFGRRDFAWPGAGSTKGLRSCLPARPLGALAQRPRGYTAAFLRRGRCPRR